MRYLSLSARNISCYAIKNLIFTLLFTFLSIGLSAQIVEELPRIRTGSKKDKPIQLKRLKIDVFVIENKATTTFEMQFYNNNDRVMEGELNFPLDNGVTVSGFALDVNGEMREGVIVEKEKATRAYEAVTRRNVDPGVVEVTKGNNFKSRVYPIPPKGYKKAVISFEQELTGDNANYIYQLPLNFKQKLEEFAVKVEVMMNKPEITKSNHPTINLNFTEARNSYISEYNKKDVVLDTHLGFSIPKPLEINEVLTYKGEVTSDNYFYINLHPVVETKPKPKPSRITIVWDESASGKKRDIEKELTILQDYLKWVKSGQVELKTFSNTLHTGKTFSIQDGKSPDLIAFLRSIQYDGGTNLGAVDLSSIDCEEILLFSDGISTFGEKAGFSFNCPVITINSSNIADHNLLEYIASASNGVYVNSFKLTAPEISNLLQNKQKSLVKVEYDAERITDFYPGTGQFTNGNFSCAGKVEGSRNKITFHFGYGDKITESQTVIIDNTKRIANPVGEKIWAQKKLRSLLITGDHSEVIQHGKKFGLVTPGTSLIVLDEVQDYVTYEITPPASLQEEYNRLLAQKRKDNTQNRQDRLEQICRQFDADVEWWKSVDNVGFNKPEPNTQAPQPIPEMRQNLEDTERINMDDAQLEEVVVMGYAAGVRVEETSDNLEGRAGLTPTVKIKKWDSDAPYMNDLKATDAKDLYKKYLTLKPRNRDNPSFYFDVATYMFERSQREDGLRVISNLAELELENTELLRTLGRKLSEYGFYKEAIAVFKEVMQVRSFEPHSNIDLGFTYAEMGEYQKAVDKLYAVIDKEWDSDIISRFPGIEMIVLHDLNNIINGHKNEIDISNINSCFVKHLPVDVRVVIDWDANETDIDLWVTDPAGEKCSYQNKSTKIGGKMSNDITAGYGPEEFRLKKAIEGKYTIQAHFYGSRKQTLLGNVTVRAIVYTGFGSKNEHKEVLTLQLEPDKNGEYTIGEMVFER